MTYSLFCPGVGVLSHVRCPMWGFSKINVPALPLSIGTCGGVGMLGIDWMKHKISLVGFCCCCFFFYLCSTCIFGFGYVVGRGGEGGEGRGGRVLGVNIVKCRNATT